ncbi:peptidoglycan-binding protein [Lentzea sp. NBRC 105346]|uniref:peptidoglycan-binding protein n=1 Tax=Lentzea sp. NBRC 105346 TaxID=3032205 RepID=UPI0024A5D594|nr:peptidoglycan-binding domain-containing protein [Lentzea sp. NBRC 105346]GLZ34354.1 peptidoglycan-binding protein [Lentzea sp. NBRC 105346]
MADRTRLLVAGLVAAVVVGTGSVVAVTRVAADRANAEPPKSEPVKTVPVTKTDLADTQSVSGTLAYGAERSLAGRKQGTVTGLPAQGAVVDRGKPLYWVDAKPVPLFYGSVPLYRDLSSGVTNGPDVKVLEENLVALGYTGFGDPDEKFTYATATALKKWQKANGLEQNGVLGQGDVVVQPGAVRVSSLSAQLGSPAGGEVMKVSGTDRAVTVELDIAKQRMAKQGDKVGIDISGGKPTTGTVTSITKVASSDPGGKPKAVVSIAVDDPAAAEGLDSASVSVVFTTGSKKGVLAVPVGALLALAEGGYAVETEDHRLIPVKTGLFAKGSVEVSGEGLSEGLKVVTTS